MIPEWNESGVLPPFLTGFTPADEHAVAPYKSTMLELVQHFSTSPERIEILKGVIAYRLQLRSNGISDGFQWLNGSFTENVEANDDRPPNDIDLITFADRPMQAQEDVEWNEFISSNLDLFDPSITKLNHKCDAYYVDMKLPSQMLVNRTRYWFGLFSHQRETFLWKGLLEIPLESDDVEARKYLQEVDNAS